MEWNSLECYNPTVPEAEIKSQCRLYGKGTYVFRLNYIIGDIRLYVGNGKTHFSNETTPDNAEDEFGRFMHAINHFPSADLGIGFNTLADYIYRKGLKFGIHIMRGVPVKAIKRKLSVKGTNFTSEDV